MLSVEALMWPGPRRSQRRRRAILPALVVLAGVGCNDPDLSWMHLARGSVETLQTSFVRVFASPDGRTFRLVTEDGETWLTTTLRRGDWTFKPARGRWRADLSVQGQGRPSNGAPAQRLKSAARDFDYSPPDELQRSWHSPPGSFAATRNGLFLKLEKAETPPATAVLAVYAGWGPGTDANGNWRVAGRRFSGEGFALWPGERVERTVDLPPASALRFATTLEPALSGSSAERRPVHWRVRLDGEVVFDHEARLADGPTFAWHEVPLPEDGGASVRLGFEAKGALSYTAFLAPVIGPAAVGSYARRPWAERAPNLVLFLADTFRADNLEAYGDELALTPYLNDLAAQSVLFRRSWSVATRTLPAHASLFSGLYPRQTGALSSSWALPDELSTIAEFLSEAGYRTAAVTDSAIVSQKLGFAQGFEWFDESWGDLPSTLHRARSVLEADDGRPLFLFVQSYRTHTPYRVSQETRRERGAELGIEGEYLDWEAAQRTVPRPSAPGTPELRELAGIYRKIVALYLGAVIDLDRGFGAFHRELAGREVLRNGYLIFTSDHGEALLEHGTLYHQGKVYEEETRIPLFISGSGLQPRVVEHAASLVDLPPTLAELAGIPRHGAWVGRPLLSLDLDRPAFAFESKLSGEPTLALIEGPRKVICYEDREALRAGVLFGAYDLARDPQEQENWVGRASWPEDLMRRLGPVAETFLEPAVAPEPAEFELQERRRLEALGYLAD